MNLLDTYHKALRTDKWRNEQAQLFARERFADFDHHAAVTVLDCLVDMLGIDFEHLHPHTELVRDLAADEEEPDWIAEWFCEQLCLAVSPEEVVQARTVGGLVEMITRRSAGAST